MQKKTSSRRSNQGFTIDDAFEEEHTDAIRVYGATTTTERSPLNGMSSQRSSFVSSGLSGIDAVSVHIHDPPNPLAVKPIIRGLTKLKDDAAARDSDSLITEDQDTMYDPSKPWCCHPKVRENWKMVFAAFFLFIFGLALTVAAFIIVALPVNGIQGAVFFIAGAICLIPGAYHVVYIYFAIKGKRGYDFQALPLFN